MEGRRNMQCGLVCVPSTAAAALALRVSVPVPHPLLLISVMHGTHLRLLQVTPPRVLPSLALDWVSHAPS